MSKAIGDIVVIDGEPRVIISEVDGLEAHYVTRAIGIYGTDVQYTDTVEATDEPVTDPAATGTFA